MGSSSEFIEKLSHEINLALHKGYTLEEIYELLTKNGLCIKFATFKRYLRKKEDYLLKNQELIVENLMKEQGLIKENLPNKLEQIKDKNRINFESFIKPDTSDDEL